MFNEYLSIGQAAKFLGISISTLRRWDKNKNLISSFRTVGNHRRYKKTDLMSISKEEESFDDRQTICYARVSTHSQKKDLETQKTFLELYCKENNIDNFKVISDLGSGLNYKKKGLNELINLIISNKIKKIIITHKDRFLRFGTEIIEKLCSFFDVEFFIINKSGEKTYEQEFCEDICAIMTVFSSKLYGKKSHKNKKSINLTSKTKNACFS